MSKQPPPAPTANTEGPCPTLSKLEMSSEIFDKSSVAFLIRLNIYAKFPSSGYE